MNTIITIGRQFGSAGREIGEKVAEYFGIKCYDKELLIRAAQESGFCEEMIQNHDERPTNSFLYNLVMDTYSFGYNASSFVDMPISHKVFLAQFDTIKKIADEGPCVIVGRCADYALADYKNCINLFIFGDDDVKTKRIMARYDLTEAKAKDIMRKLFDYYYSHPDKLPADFIPQLDFDGISRTICDYIAGMTDKYAIYTYSEIFIPTAWQVR